MAQARTILCMKWGTLYPADYVNVLYNACRKATDKPFRFVCLTDDARGLIEGIEAFDLPDIGLREHYKRGGGWQKFGLFKPEMHREIGLEGRILYIDLDMIVLRDLDAFFEREGAFITTDMGPRWGGHKPNARPETGTCMFAFDAHREGDMYHRFTAQQDRWIRDYSLEQDVVAFLASDMDYWPDGWVISFKRSMRRPIGLNLFQPPAPPPETAKVLAFHGEPRPIDLMTDGQWGRLPHVGPGRVEWARRYWLDNGGSLPD